jgi:hypothetical protein
LWFGKTNILKGLKMSHMSEKMIDEMNKMAEPDFHDGKEIPMTVADLQSLYHILHDEILLRGNEHITMFLMDLKDAWRKGELSKFKNLE